MADFSHVASAQRQHPCCYMLHASLFLANSQLLKISKSAKSSICSCLQYSLSASLNQFRIPHQRPSKSASLPYTYVTARHTNTNSHLHDDYNPQLYDQSKLCNYHSFTPSTLFLNDPSRFIFHSTCHECCYFTIKPRQHTKHQIYISLHIS